jgi:hypothetical protein
MSLRIRRYRVTHVMRCFAALLFFMPAATPLQAQGFQLDPPRGPVPPVYFGLHIHHLWQDTGWPDIPFGTWRLWDAHVLWAYLEPSPGKYDFELLDRYVQVANQHGVELVLTLQGPPTWASARPAEVPVHQGGGKGLPGSAAEPKSFSTWEDFVRAVASRYRGKIKYYELWNEPMSRPYFSGTPEQMVALAKSASAILKQIDPENKLLSPPVSGDSNGLEWLSKFLSAGGGQYVDIYGFHFYVGGVPEQAIPKVQSARVLLRQFGQDQKPMWNTEAGWQISQLAPSVAADSTDGNRTGRQQQHSDGSSLCFGRAVAHGLRCYSLSEATERHVGGRSNVQRRPSWQSCLGTKRNSPSEHRQYWQRNGIRDP